MQSPTLSPTLSAITLRCADRPPDTGLDLADEVAPTSRPLVKMPREAERPR